MCTHVSASPHLSALAVTVSTMSLEVWAPLHRFACVCDTVPVYAAYSLPRLE